MSETGWTPAQQAYKMSLPEGAEQLEDLMKHMRRKGIRQSDATLHQINMTLLDAKLAVKRGETARARELITRAMLLDANLGRDRPDVVAISPQEA
jgi:hypothetical protein